MLVTYLASLNTSNLDVGRTTLLWHLVVDQFISCSWPGVGAEGLALPLSRGIFGKPMDGGHDFQTQRKKKSHAAASCVNRHVLVVSACG